jgi:hypothetical protein
LSLYILLFSVENQAQSQTKTMHTSPGWRNRESESFICVDYLIIVS